MNDQGLSTIAFEEGCTIDESQTARSLFTRLEHGHPYAGHLLDCLATGYLVALLESVCIREMLQHLDLATEVVVGRAIDVQHRAPVPAGKRIWVRGWTTRLGDRKATFEVQAFDDHETICEGTLTLVVASRNDMERRLARKL
jgi:predicted thioesterase